MAYAAAPKPKAKARKEPLLKPPAAKAKPKQGSGLMGKLRAGYAANAAAGKSAFPMPPPASAPSSGTNSAFGPGAPVPGMAGAPPSGGAPPPAASGGGLPQGAPSPGFPQGGGTGMGVAPGAGMPDGGATVTVHAALHHPPQAAAAKPRTLAKPPAKKRAAGRKTKFPTPPKGASA